MRLFVTYLNKILFFFSIIIAFLFNNFILASAEESFDSWLKDFKKKAISKGISEETLKKTFVDVKYLEQVIKYDRKQPEFFEDTLTYVGKRSNQSRVNKGRKLLKSNMLLFNDGEKNVDVEKEILIALWGIETNFGKHVGKMDIVSSLATLSYDKRRRDFFSSQLLTLLKLIDKNLIDPSDLYGSWAGAYGNFQFMPSTIMNYAIDYDGNGNIELKNSLKDSVASASNYINKIGWKKDTPCFYRVTLNKKINKKFINTSARNIKNKLPISKWVEKGVVNFDGSEFRNNLKAALILPDGKDESPAYLVFDNYEKILKWNRSLRFAISVCTLAKKIKL